MKRLRLLLIPGNNSLSHIAKSLAIKSAFETRGHEAMIAVSKQRSKFLDRLGAPHTVLPDIQENDHAGLPTVEWFKRPEPIRECIKAEVELMRRFEPDRVMGIFRFTTKVAASIAGIPFDSLICGCMHPAAEEVLGFAEGEKGIEFQRANLQSFFKYAARKFVSALPEPGFEDMDDIRYFLEGDRTYLWDYPEFMPLPETAGATHIGPIFWHEWPYDPLDPARLLGGEKPVALVTFGTCMKAPDATERMVRVLLDLGFKVVAAAGGQGPSLKETFGGDPMLICCDFAPFHKLLPYASLVVCHGGQMTVFESMSHEVPALVFPFHPEQAHNGVCLERAGCGARLVTPRCFLGNSEVYVDALARMTDSEITDKINGLNGQSHVKTHLAGAKAAMNRYGGVETLLDRFEV